ncbi:MAG: hydrolase [Lentisphaerae bacterium]|nr:hydrolase [Lentisphaerota bacterium]
MNTDKLVLVLVDVQSKLAQLMHDKESLFSNLQKLISGIKALSIPIIWLEQNPSKMGPTISELSQLLTDENPIPKMSFSGCGEPACMAALRNTNRTQIILAGIETHVCIWQTTADLLAAGYEVEIVTDAVSSRAFHDKQIALQRMESVGARLTTTEMILFELLKTAKHPAFKTILKIVK